MNGEAHQTFPNRAGLLVDTISAASLGGEHVETRGCGYRGPGHDWLAARRERDRGFLAAGTGNDRFALTYYEAEDLPVYAAFARRFSVFDRWHASLLGPTFPNRQYLVSGQSEGRKSDPVPLRAGIFRAETIYERLSSRAVPVAYYHTSAPLLALWGADRMAPFIRSLDRYFEDAGAGTLPNVSFIDPELGGSLRTDDHPQGDIRMGQRWVREIFKAFVASPQWQRGALFVTYDEGGGFFDHVRPPVLADERASRRDIDNFGQAGFRVPTILACLRTRVRKRRPSSVRPHVTAALPGMAIPGRSRRGDRRWSLGAHRTRPACPESGSLDRPGGRSGDRLRCRRSGTSTDSKLHCRANARPCRPIGHRTPSSTPPNSTTSSSRGFPARPIAHG